MSACLPSSSVGPQPSFPSHHSHGQTAARPLPHSQPAGNSLSASPASNQHSKRMAGPASSHTVREDDQVLQQAANQYRSLTPNEHSKADAATSGTPSDLTCFGEACVRPRHPLTASELQKLREPGDVVTNASGHKVRMVKNERGEHLFESSLEPTESPLYQTPQSSPSHRADAPEQPSSKTPPRPPSSLPQPTSRESSVSTKAPPSKTRARGVSRRTAIDPENIICLPHGEGERSHRDTPPTSSAPASSYSFRTRAAGNSALRYDAKYHPMDDAIRPSQAAKRRSLHGELQVSSDDSEDASSICAASSDESDEEGPIEDVKKKTQPPQKGTKRTRRQCEAREPTRRSARQTGVAKVSYDMTVHPQDDDLIVLSSDDDKARPVHAAKRKKGEDSNAAVIESDSVDSSDEIVSSVEDDLDGISREAAHAPDIITKTSSPVSSAATPPFSGVRRKEGLDVWLLPTGTRYFMHDRDSWPSAPGRPFEIYESSFEEQMEADASAASPLAHDHDDKENNITNPAFDEPHQATDGMSVIPASQYRRTSEDSNALREQSFVTEAFFQYEQTATPYGLGVDGALEEQDHASDTDKAPSAMSILLSGAQLPAGPTTEEQADELDSVLGLMSSTDSVLGYND